MEAREAKGFTQTEMATMIGMGLRMYQKIEAGQFPKYKRENITAIDKILGTNLYELIYAHKADHVGNENIVSDGDNKYKYTSSQVRMAPFENYMEVPYKPVYAQAGNMIGFSPQEIDTMDTILVPKEFEKGNYLVIEIDGDSMDDGTSRSICDCDKVLLKEIELHSFVTGQINTRRSLFCIIYKSEEREGILVKEVVKITPKSDTFTIHSWNPSYKNENLKLKNILQVFTLKKIVEKKIKF